jgi:hypothetical protein
MVDAFLAHTRATCVTIARAVLHLAPIVCHMSARWNMGTRRKSHDEPPSLAALLVLSQPVLGLTQETLGELLGVSRSTMVRWQGRGVGSLLPSQVATLVQALAPRDLALAEAVAAHHHVTLESLGVTPPGEPRRAEPGANTALVVDAIVCAAAEAMNQPPGALRLALVAAFERAKALGLSVDDVLGALRTRSAAG